MSVTFLIVAYGAGHAKMVCPVINALKKSPAGQAGELRFQVLAPPAALATFQAAEIEAEGFSAYLDPVTDADAIDWGEDLAQVHHAASSGIPYEQSVAYLGLCYKDLVERLGAEQAQEKFKKHARHAFFPLTILERVFDRHNPDFVLTTNSPRSEAAAIEIANKRNVDNMIMTDLFTGMLNYPLKAKNITFLNQVALDQFRKDGLIDPETSNLYLTGGPGFDPLVLSQPDDPVARLSDFFPVSDDSIAVVHADMPAYLDGKSRSSHTRSEAEILAELDACYEAAVNNGALYLIRPHPSQSPAFYENWLKYRKNAYLANKIDLYPLLRRADLVLARTTTVALEAIYLRCRVLQIDISSIFDLPLHEMGVAWGVETHAELHNKIGKALVSDTEFNNKLARAKEILPWKPAAQTISEIILHKCRPQDYAAPSVSKEKPITTLTKYETEVPDKAFYGLPHAVKFCKNCVISNQRPNSSIEQKHTKHTKKKVIAFKDGVCDACLTKNWKDHIDWDEREQQLIALCDKHRSKNGSYDCLVPGSGGKDSFMQSHVLKYKYGMNPLTVTWAPHIYTDWGWNNFQAWIHSGFNNHLVSPNGRVHRLLTRLSTENLLHPFQPFIIGQRHLAAKMAALHDIQLIFYGESGSEYGNPSEENESAKRDFAEYEYFTMSDDSDVYLGGISFKDLKEIFKLKQHDLDAYMPIDPQVCEDKKIEIHYLGYYMKWHPQSAYYYAVEHGGFQAAPERTLGTYSKYNSIDDKMDDLHYFTTFIKFGIGRATYDASQEVRSGDINRDEGIALVRKFDGEYPHRFENELFKYMSVTEEEFGKDVAAQFHDPIMTKESFMELVNKFRSPHLWRYKDGEWSLRHSIAD